jgi:hypothetical protein
MRSELSQERAFAARLVPTSPKQSQPIPNSEKTRKINIRTSGSGTFCSLRHSKPQPSLTVPFIPKRREDGCP